MSNLKKMQCIKTDFIQGPLAIDELFLHVEPLLRQLISTAEDEAEVKTIINGIERVIYTQIEPQKTNMILELLDQGIVFVTQHEN